MAAESIFCKWNVGDPERTTTAVGRWYLFHGKFIVTDKAAIALSANFTSTRELDAAVIFKNRQDKIDEFNKVFETLIDLFITAHNGYEGKIRQLIIDTGIPNVEQVFQLPSVIETQTHIKNWIQQYPKVILRKEGEIQEKFYISPIDYKARALYEKIIKEAEKFVYLSAESFTDFDFSDVLIQVRMRGVKVRVLAGANSQDFQDRLRKMFRQLLAQDIEFHTVKEDLHAKILLTEKYLVIGSVNLNKMNLGFQITQSYWRANIKTLVVIKNVNLIAQSKINYEENFDKGMDVENKLAEKVQNELGRSFTSKFGLKSTTEVKRLLLS